MNPYLVAAGIRFNDYVFSEPRRLVEWAPPKCAGVCAILARDANWAPKPFQPLCFLEFGNNSDLRRLARTPNTDALFVSAIAMPFSTSAQRTEVRNQLVWAYNPIWEAGTGATAQSDLAHKLDELERKHEEQTTQFRLLLASINRLFEPQTEMPRHRAIGFLAPAASSPETQATQA
jgi:hypothetical protein